MFARAPTGDCTAQVCVGIAEGGRILSLLALACSEDGGLTETLFRVLRIGILLHSGCNLLQSAADPISALLRLYIYVCMYIYIYIYS